MPWESARWLIAERMGWTLEYVDGLDVRDVLEGMATWRAQAMAKNR